MKFRRIFIITDKHTKFIASLISSSMMSHYKVIPITLDSSFSIKAIIQKVIIKYLLYISNSLCFIICPQLFKRLPKNNIVYQLEQLNSNEWFNDCYFNNLKNSQHICDYSLTNIDILSDYIKKDKLSYLPLVYHDNYFISLDENDSIYDITFYGHINDRRKTLLNNLSKYFKINIITNSYGDNLLHKLIRSKIVINIHYYEGALLETTRIYECLSLGVFVVSEDSPDLVNYGELTNIVEFIDSGDLASFKGKLRYWLSNDKLRQDRISSYKRLLMPFRLEFDNKLLNLVEECVR